jgi:nucleoside transporter
MVPYLRTRLSVQMFLQFAIWGAWAPVMALHLKNLGFDPVQAGNIQGTAAIATIIAPLIAGQIADRWFATQRFLSLSFLAAGALLFLAAKTTDYTSLLLLSLGSFLFFGPTLGLANSLSFHHMTDPAKQFPVVRLFGTVGWIVAGYSLSFVQNMIDVDQASPMPECLYLGAGFAIANGLYCMTLPKTPPKRDASDPLAVRKALFMLKDGSFALFMVLAFVLLALATFYYFRASVFFQDAGVRKENIAYVMGIGQIMEILTMLLLPLAYAKLGAKKTIAIGLFAWALRFAIFAIGSPLWLMIVAQGLHGFCFAFAIAAGMIYVERVCPPDVRASAQSLLTLVTYGAGMYVGAWLSGMVSARYTVGTTADWRSIFLVPALGCLALLVLFLMGFRARDAAGAVAAPPGAGASPAAAAPRGNAPV